jgi:hypothetical protein
MLPRNKTTNCPPMKKLFFPAIVAVLTALPTANAQVGAPNASPGINAALPRLFGDVTAFSAKADVQVLDKEQKEKVATPMGFSLLDKKVRVEMDMTQMKSKDMPAGAAASMKQLGMDRVVSIILPEQKVTYIIFPGLQSYVNMPLPKEDTATFEKNPKPEKTEVGKETIDGHPCVKRQVVVTDDQGVKHEATVWEATDLKDFPVRILTTEKDDTIIMRFKDIKLAKPDAKQFDKPEGFKEYPDAQSMMQAVMAKMVSGGGQP